MRGRTIVLLALVLAPAAARAAGPPPGRRGAARAAAGALLWPVDRVPEIVSSFGEYRYDHLHAGIDISTGGATGLPVRAAAEGTVVRLKVEWRGYGRALYLRHADGRTTVYGHLERFEEAALGLEARVARRQSEAGTRYPGDILLDPPVPVRRGQVIAFSGESGVGLPHLHFEVRGPADEPMDPLQAGLPAPHDAEPPVLDAVVVMAAEPAAFLDGTLREVTLPLERRGPFLEPREPLRVSGAFTASLLAWDPAGGGRSGLRSVETAIDGRPCYHLDLTRFRFDQYPLAGLIFDHRESHLGPTIMAWRLVGLPGNALAADACADAERPGAIRLSDGGHRLEIAARDPAGRESRARICVLAGRPGLPAGARLEERGAPPPGAGAVARFDPPAEKSAPAGSDACHPPPLSVEGEWLAGSRARPLDCRAAQGFCASPPGSDPRPGEPIRLRLVAWGVPGPWLLLPPPATPSETRPELRALPGFADLALAAPPQEAPPGAPCADLPAPLWRPVDAGFDAGIDYAEALRTSRAGGACAIARAFEGTRLLVLGPHEAGEIREERYRVEVPVGARFFPGPLLARTVEAAGVPEGIRTDREAVDILPEGEALDARATLAFPLAAAADDRAWGVYRWDRVTRRWSYEGGAYDAARHEVGLAFRRYGRFLLARDEAPPSIVKVRPVAGARTGLRPDLEAWVEDTGEGLDFDGVQFRLDGRTLESEYDPDRGVSRPFAAPEVPPGPHHLEVRAVDRAGNASAVVEVDFEAR